MTMTSFDSSAVAALALDDFEAAASSIAKDVVYTPVLPHFVEGRFQGVHLKAECLQPLGSFKIRGASYVAGQLDALGGRRIATASMGNFAQGLALAAQRRALSLTVHVPENAARIKVAALHRLGATVVEHPFDAWWEIMTTRETGADDGVFVHPVCEQGVIAGNGCIGLEIAAQLPDVETVVVPFGGGGLVCGIALALRACGHRARVVAVEVETAAPLAAARSHGGPVDVVRQTSFVDGIGSTRVLAPMWPLLNSLVDDVEVVSLDEVRSAMDAALQGNHLLIEGAAGAALAAAARRTRSSVCAVISGGNIDPAVHHAQVRARA